jgi:uncharacterized protein
VGETGVVRDESDYKITVLRCGASPSAVLVVTDADGLLGLVSDTVELMRLPGLVPDLLIIGVGYLGATSIEDTIEQRIRDLTPTGWSPFPGSGGGPAFEEFLRSEVLMIAASEVPNAPVYFVGHSLGGMFGAWLLVTSNPFDGYILGSPSLWWHNDKLLNLPIPEDVHASVFVGIGEHETDLGRRRETANLPPNSPHAAAPQYLDMVDDLHRWKRHLDDANPRGLDLKFTVFADEYHSTVFGPILSHGLRHLFKSDSEATSRG